MRPRLAIVFDLDGTLVDSLDDILDTFLATFAELGEAGPERSTVRALVGRPLEEMYAGFVRPDRLEAFVAAYRERYRRHLADKTRPYPGVVDVLSELGERGYARLVATTKRSATARELVAAVGLTGYVDHVQGTDGFPHKPAPDVILRALDAAGAQGAWMVGDTTSDIAAGRAAGLRTFGVTWGTHDAATLASAGPDAVAPTIGPLLSLL
jgi:phosphoglycolate phosphatase